MRKIFFISIIIFVFYFEIVNAQEFQQIITISSEDQQCTNDKDCTAVETDCIRISCECGGKPVNGINEQKYKSLLEECRKNQKYPIMICDQACDSIYEKCANGECTFFEKDSDEMPKLKQSEVKKIVEELAVKENFDLYKFKDPKVTFDPKEKIWRLFYEQKYIGDSAIGEFVAFPGGDLMLKINDLTGEISFVPRQSI